MPTKLQIEPFTLLEVLVAVTVCGVVFVVLLTGFGQNLRYTAQAEDYTKAIILAKSKIAALEVQESLEEGKQHGDFGEKFERFRWETDISNKNEQELPLYNVNVTVYFKRTVTEQSVILNTILYKKKTMNK